MKLHLEARLEQQQILAPQMILSMDILHLNTADLESRIEKEFMENPALELEEDSHSSDSQGAATEVQEPAAESASERDSSEDPEIQEIYELLNTFESRYGGEERPRRQQGMEEASGSKQEALLNHADRPDTLHDHLQNEIGFLELEPEVALACRQLAGNVDARGYLIGDLEEFAVLTGISNDVAQRALLAIQSLEPAGVGARDLRECLLLQLGSDQRESLEYRIVADHLGDLLENRMPRIADRLQVPLGDVREAVEVISLLNPQPGGRFSVPENNPAVPELFVDEIQGRFVVRMEEGVLPSLKISPACSTLLSEGGENKKVLEFVRRKVEAARWLIHAIEQRRRTLTEIAQAIVDHQDQFMRSGPGHLAALTMQSIADRVGVHVSTVSRATNGKYIETPFGVHELRRFFTGGVERADGGIESRDNVCQVIAELVAAEDEQRPLSDSQLTKKLQERGLDIARRTVSKYRERAGIAPARLRRKY